MNKTLYQTIDELTELCERQAETIRRQTAALAQLGAAVEEDERVGSGLLEED